MGFKCNTGVSHQFKLKIIIVRIGRILIPKDFICQNKVPEKYSLRCNI